ncbi:hypothetical protein LNI88_02010 [Tenacibaculum dicentrarchi]|nr:hypothetical protein [Tenacibaculum dicentrarchi]MCD8424061.1 hypothetical protein [Tenacibaculum dicentrarchi]MCD8441366.1 hypothetical protein [Tenacibaculum dicentrarchi]
MMKHILYKTASLVFLGLAMASCEPEFTETGMLTTEDKRPVATASVSSLQIKEGKSGSVKFTLDKAIGEPSILLVSVVGAENDEENNQVLNGFTFNSIDNEGESTALEASSSLEFGRGFELKIPAYTTQVELSIETSVETNTTTDQKFVVRIEDHTYNYVKTNKNGSPIFIPITIKDTPSLDLTLDFNTSGPNGADLCESGVKFQFYLVDTEGNYTDPVKGDCTSEMKLNINTIKSGTYTIEGYLSDYGDFPKTDTDPVVDLTIPFHIATANKSKSVDLTFNTANDAWGQIVDAGTVTVNNNATYIVKDANGNILVDTTK